MDLDFPGNRDDPIGIQPRDAVGDVGLDRPLEGMGTHAGQYFLFHRGIRDHAFDLGGIAGEDRRLQDFGEGFALAGGDMDREGEAPGQCIEAGPIGGKAGRLARIAAGIAQDGQEVEEEGRAQQMGATRQGGCLGKPFGEGAQVRDGFVGQGVEGLVEAALGAGAQGIDERRVEGGDEVAEMVEGVHVR